MSIRAEHQYSGNRSINLSSDTFYRTDMPRYHMPRDDIMYEGAGAPIWKRIRCQQLKYIYIYIYMHEI